MVFVLSSQVYLCHCILRIVFVLLLSRYFSIDIEESTTDLLVSITPFFGDPDMFVSLYETPEDLRNHSLPSKEDFEWQSISFGADTIQVQVLSVINGPLFPRVCSFVGVFGLKKYDSSAVLCVIFLL